MPHALPDDPAVRAAFDAQPPALRDALLELRGHVLDAAMGSGRVGELVETLKWGEPAYLSRKPRVGTTVRINAVKGSADRYGAYFHCQTTLLESFRHIYPDAFSYEGSRAIFSGWARPIPPRRYASA